jgi:hypothetical protein
VSFVDRAEAEGSTIHEVVPVEGLAPETQEAAGASPEATEVASRGAEGSDGD